MPVGPSGVVLKALEAAEVVVAEVVEAGEVVLVEEGIRRRGGVPVGMRLGETESQSNLM